MGEELQVRKFDGVWRAGGCMTGPIYERFGKNFLVNTRDTFRGRKQTFRQAGFRSIPSRDRARVFPTQTG